ncbi:MAG: beta-1,6-N-acetylglucosaminyltransferase, partial [Gemmatimonadaceae bacterium]|nr:beta-1,6-N-acetylglucosaminyltransferase [Gemmatimonadaceae bacterium]
MSTTVGFVIVSHSPASPAVTLCRDLADLYGNPPIALHHDTTQCALDTTALPSCVSVVTPSVATGWGTMGVVRATIRALSVLYARPDAPEWFALLTESCYPIAPPAVVRAELAAVNADVLLDHQRIGYADQPAPAWDVMPPLG